MTTLTRDEYSIGWICALHNEYTAAKSMLDERHGDPEDPSPNERDDNHYTLGRIGNHSVVIGVLPSGEYGTAAAASVATNMISSFPNVKIGLMVGIGGGAPLPDEHDIRLGDVVVSHPANGHSGVIQYDYGKAIQNEDFQLTRVLNQPPPVLRSAMAGLRSRHDEESNGLEELVAEILEKNKRLKKKYQRPSRATDRLFRADVLHSDQRCGESQEDLVSRSSREHEEDEDNAQVHYGLVATANTLMKDSLARDRLAKAHGILCFEMEAGGLMNSFPCLVIRGICDYSDTHKNKEWQGYAAMTAAGYAKALINELAPAKVEKEQKIGDLVAAELTKLQTLTQRIISDKASDDIQHWLSPVDPSTNFNRAVGARHKGSGQWILRNQAYKKWKEGPDKALWLKGKAGCGKTVLSSTVIQDLREVCQNLLRSLLYQMHRYQGDQSLLYHLYRSCQEKSGLSQPNFDKLNSTFSSMSSSCDEMYIVLDALDECTTRTELLDWVKSACKNITQLRLLATSRPEYQIEASMSCLSNIILLNNDCVNEDISRFVHDIVQNDESLSRWRKMPEVQQEIELSLVTKANGMFRWVSCQLDSLKDCLSYPELRKALQSLPVSLDETYARALKGIPAPHLPHAITMLQFITYSKRVYRAPELADAITVSLDDRPRFDPKNRMPVPEELIRYCSSLALVDSETNTVQLAHFSVKEWLLSDRLDSDISHHFIDSQAHAKIAQVLLSMVIFLISFSKSSDRHQIQQDHPLTRHAIQAWASHAALAQDAVASVNIMALEFLSNTVAFQRFSELHGNDPFWAYHNRPISALHFTAYEGLYKASKQLIERGMKISKTYPSPVFWASKTGQERIVKLLLDNGASATERIGRKKLQSSLEVASENGSRGIVRFLIDAGADVNLQSYFGGDALLWAVRKNFKSIVEELLDSGATRSQAYEKALAEAATSDRDDMLGLLLVRSQQKAASMPLLEEALARASQRGYISIVKLLLEYGVTTAKGSESRALTYAIRQGHEDILQVLLDYEDKVPCEEGRFGRAVRIASNEGQLGVLKMLFDQGADLKELDSRNGGILESTCKAWLESDILTIVKFLLDKGADVNASGGWFGNALQAASYRGHHAIVQLLLDAGALVNSRGGKYGTALQAASYENRSDIVETLLEHGADVNMQVGQWSNALQAATVCGDEAIKIVLKLLHWGASINAEGGPYDSALQAAVDGNHVGILKVLLDHGALADVKTKNFAPPLFRAIDREHSILDLAAHEKVIELLLDYGASPNTKVTTSTGELQSVLLAAAHRGDKGVIKLLLARGANAQNDMDGALIIVSSKGRVDIAKELLDRNADPNAFNEVAGTALQAASKSGNQDLVRLLVEKGAHPISEYGECETLLHDAAASGKIDLVRLLLKMQVDVNTRGGRHGHALQAAAKGKREKIVQLLLDSGANAHARGGEDGTALHAAVSLPHPSIDIVKMLLQAGVDVNANAYIPVDSHATALIQAVRHSEEPLKLCILLLESGADVNAQAEGENDSVLHVAAWRGLYELFDLFLECGANINSLSCLSGTPLQAAAAAGQGWEVKLLLDKGADINAYCRGCNEGSPLLAAVMEGSKSIVKYLIKRGADVNNSIGVLGDALQTSIIRKEKGIARLLIQNGANINAVGGRHGSPLQAAAARDLKRMTKFLIKRGANVNCGGGKYGSPLQTAVACGRGSMARLFIEKGADVNSEGGRHGTPLQAAVLSNSKPLVKLLIDKGANINSGGGRYGSPLNAAVQRKLSSLEKILLKHGAKAEAKTSK